MAFAGRRRRLAVGVAAIALVAGACGGSPILANPPITFPSPMIASPAPSRAADPIPISFPRDDGPHDRLTEWWYYTGHLHTAAGRRFGFEAVIFRAERGAVPVAWASHLALTDEDGNRFLYAQRSEVGPQADHSPRDAAGLATGFDLRVGGLSPVLVARGAPATAAPWRLVGANGTDRIEAALTPEEAAESGAPFAIALDLRALKPAALHDVDGFVDFQAAGSSYYYSRTRLSATGMLQLDGQQLDVEGIAWFDHQWGDFVSVGGGGWDWFAINLGDGSDLTMSIVRDEAGQAVLSYGTLVSQDGEVRHLGDGQFAISTVSEWLSPRTDRTWPWGWAIQAGEYSLFLTPTVSGQELDTQVTTGVTYWEGSQAVAATRLEGAGAVQIVVGGEAYVEITRYGLPGD